MFSSQSKEKEKNKGKENKEVTTKVNKNKINKCVTPLVPSIEQWEQDLVTEWQNRNRKKSYTEYNEWQDLKKQHLDFNFRLENEFQEHFETLLSFILSIYIYLFFFFLFFV